MFRNFSCFPFQSILVVGASCHAYASTDGVSNTANTMDNESGLFIINYIDLGMIICFFPVF